MKRTLIPLIPALLLASAAAAGPQAPASGASGSPLTDTPPTGLSADPAQRPCVQQTGTRIVRRQQDGCVAGVGRSYDRRDIASTGETRTGHALKMLDPAIR
jgi:hypothetical protein